MLIAYAYNTQQERTDLGALLLCVLQLYIVFWQYAHRRDMFESGV